MKGIPADILGIRNAIASLSTQYEVLKQRAASSGESINRLKAASLAAAAGTKILQAAMVALNVAASMAISYGISKLISAYQESKQAAKDAAESSKETSNSLRDLVSQYKELGDKSGWDTDDFEQARDINDEILDLLKGQSDTMDEKLSKLDLENGKYQEQLDLLNDISCSKANVNLAEQQNALTEYAKENLKVGTNPITATSKKMAEFLVANGIGSYNGGQYSVGNVIPDDPDSVLAFYENLNKAIELLGKNFTTKELSESKFDDYFTKQINGLKDYVNNVKDAQDFFQDSQREQLKAQTLTDLQSQKNDLDEHIKAKTDSIIKQSEAYQEALANLESAEEDYTQKGVDIYGNISNFDRGRLDWTDENIKKFKAFYDEFNAKNPEDPLNDYSTILGSDDPIMNSENAPRIAFTPMLQTEDGLIPLTDDEIWGYLDKVAKSASEMEGGLTADNILKVDAEGLDQMVNGAMTHVRGMIAAVEGEMKNGSPLSAADVSAIAGWSEEDLIDYYGESSKYVGLSMHDIQSDVEDTKKEVSEVYDELAADAEKSAIETKDDFTNSYTQIKDAVDYLQAGVSKFDASKLQDLLNSDGKGLSQSELRYFEELKSVMSDMGFDPSNTDDVATFVEIIKELGMVAPSAADATSELAQAASDSATQIKNASQAVDDMQAAYQACKTAVDEYNKSGFVNVDTLQKLSALEPQYLAMLVNRNGQLEINTETTKKLTAATIQTQRAALLAKALTDIQQTTTLESAKKVLGEAQAVIGDATVLLNSALYDSAETALSNNGSFEEMQTVLSAGRQIISNYQTLDALWADLANQDIDKVWGKTSKTSKTASKSVTDAAQAFDTLTKAMKEYNQYGYVSADTMKSLMGLEDKFTTCLVKNGNKLEINANAFRKLIEQQLAQEAASKKGSKSADELKRILGYLDKNVKSDTISFEQLTDAIKGYGSAMDEALEKTNTIKSAFSDLKDVIKTLSDSQFGIGDADSIDKQADAIRNLVTQFKDYPDLLNNIVDENGNINLNTDAFKKALAETLEELANTAKETGGAGADALYNVYHNASQNISQGKITPTDWASGLGTDLSNANDVLDRYQSNWNTLKDAMDEWNKTGQFTQDTMQNLMALPDEFSSLLQYDENGNAKLDVKTLRDNYVKQLEELAKEFEGKPIGIQAEAAIEDVREPTPEEYEELAKKTLTYQKALAKYTAKVAKIDSNKNLTEDEALQQKAEAQTELDGALQDSLKEVQETDAQVTKKLKEHWDGAEKVIEEFKSALSDLKSVFSDLLSLIEKLSSNQSNDLKLWGEAMTEDIDKRIDALNKQKEALEDANDEEERAITLAKLQAELEKARTQRTVRKYTSNGYEWVADASAVKEAQDNLNDQQRIWRKEDAEKAIDDQIDKLNELKDKYSEIINLIGTSWDDYNKKLKYSAQIQDMAFSDMEGRVDGYKNDIVNSMKAASSTDGIKNVISNLETLVGTLTKVNNLYSWVEEGFGTYTDKGEAGLFKRIINWFGGDGKTNLSTSWDKVVKNIKGIFSKSNDAITDVAIDGATEMSTQVATELNSNKGLVGVFKNVWSTIKTGATNLFSGSDGLIAKVINGVSKLAQAAGSGLANVGGQIVNRVAQAAPAITGVVSQAGSALTGIVSNIGSALGIGTGTATTAGVGTAAGGLITGAAALGVYNGVKFIKNQKEIWSSDDNTGTKIAKSIGQTLWDATPVGALCNLVGDIFGINKKIAKNTEETNKKDNKNTTENKIYVLGNVKNPADSMTTQTKQETQAQPSFWDRFWGSKFWFWNWGKRATGDKGIKRSGVYNVDEQGPELLVRQPASGRYTYLETGDGVIPADITSRLFEMGGNPDKWFSDQMARTAGMSNIQNHTVEGDKISIGDIYIQNPVGNANDLANSIIHELPARFKQQQSKR